MTDAATSLSPELLAILACPRHHCGLVCKGARLVCEEGCEFPVVEGIPVMLLAEQTATIGVMSASLQAAASGTGAPLYLATIGLDDHERVRVQSQWDANPDAPIDPAISNLVGATSGDGYLALRGGMTEYPIPNIPLPEGSGAWLMDLGCNWGRWTVSAERRGWRAVGLDPSLGALLASRRALGKTSPNAHRVCGDARFPPFRDGVFAQVFSYSVIQHFSEDDAQTTLLAVGRVLRSGGQAKIQMAHLGGLRSTWHRTRPGYAKSGMFWVRYWSLQQLRERFTAAIGPTALRAEAYGGLGILGEDYRFVNAKGRVLILASALMKALARVFPPLIGLADSVYVTATKP